VTGKLIVPDTVFAPTPAAGVKGPVTALHPLAVAPTFDRTYT
jgi:hypothetical protein